MMLWYIRYQFRMDIIMKAIRQCIVVPYLLLPIKFIFKVLRFKFVSIALGQVVVQRNIFPSF